MTGCQFHYVLLVLSPLLQIGFISDETAERPGNYEISEEELQSKTGPNLNDIFVVSSTRREPSAPIEERPRSRTRISRPSSGEKLTPQTHLNKSYTQGSEASLSAGDSDNDSPPPSYTSVLGYDLSEYVILRQSIK